MNHQTKTALVGATAVCLALLALGILAVSAYSLHQLNGQAHALAFLCGFLTCLVFIAFPVVVGLCLRLLKRARTHKELDGSTCYPDEMDPVEWLQLRNVMTSLGFTTTVTYQGKRKVARFVLKEPVS